MRQSQRASPYNSVTNSGDAASGVPEDAQGAARHVHLQRRADTVLSMLK